MAKFRPLSVNHSSERRTSQVSARRWRHRLLGCACAVLLGGAVQTEAAVEGWGALFAHDVDVMTVTDVTNIGHSYPVATPAQPVYYKLIDLGNQPFGRVWAGESLPDRRRARRWLMKTLAEQGYRLADELHSPTQLLVFVWGMSQGIGPEFLGADATRLPPHRPFRTGGVLGKVLDFAEADLFLGMVRAYTPDSETSPEVTLLWETRFGCPSTGLALSDVMPLLIKAIGPSLGRDTPMPVNVNASEIFKGRVDLGEVEFLDIVPGETKDNPSILAPETEENR